MCFKQIFTQIKVIPNKHSPINMKYMWKFEIFQKCSIYNIIGKKKSADNTTFSLFQIMRVYSKEY